MFIFDDSVVKVDFSSSFRSDVVVEHQTFGHLIVFSFYYFNDIATLLFRDKGVDAICVTLS